MTYTVYLRTNKINGKQYVGQTSNFKQRERQWRCLKWYYANKELTNDRNTFGVENFDIVILFETEDAVEASEKECEYIAKYNTLYPNGYNVSTGGKKGFKYQNDIVKARALKISGEGNYWFGKTFSKEHREKICNSNRGKKRSDDFRKHMSEITKGEKNPAYGTTHTDEWKKHMSKLMTGRKMPKEAIEKSAKGKWKPVVQVCEDGTIIKYRCLKDVQEKGYKRGSVSQCCEKRYIREGNRIYKKCEWFWESDYEKMLEEQLILS